MSSTVVKILAVVSGLILLGSLEFVVYNQIQLKKQATAIQTQVVAQQQLVDGIVRSQSQYASKDDIASFASANGVNLQAIQTNLASLGAQLAAINVATVDSAGQTASNLPSTGTGSANPTPPTPTTVACPNGGTVACPNTDPYGYQLKSQQLTLNESFAGNVQVPIGSVGFSAWQQDPWNINILPREYSIATVVGVDQNEKQTFYNRVSVSVDGKSYDVAIKNATTKQETPTASFSIFNPRLLIGLDGGINITHFEGQFSPTINLGIMSYGQSKITPDFSILEVGAGYETVSKTAQLVITPVAYNVGKNFFAPLASNTYLGPSLTLSSDGSFGANLALRVGF